MKPSSQQIGQRAAWVLFCIFLAVPPASAATGPVHREPVEVKNILIGPHPEYTRILINLDQRVNYRVRADFKSKRISLILENSRPGPKLHSRIFKDRNLEKIEVSRLERLTKIHFFLKNPNTRFIHFQKQEPSQIVLDLKGFDKPFLQARAEPAAAEAEPAVPQRPAKDKTRVRIPGMTRKQIRALLEKDLQDKKKNGWDDYQKALKLFQSKDYPAALTEFEKFVKNHPESKYNAAIAYLTAEAEFRLVFRDPHPLYEKAFSAFQFAVRQYPDSRFKDHALMKLAYIYGELGYILEAKMLYEEGLRGKPKGPYTQARKLELAFLMLEEKRFEDAYRAFNRILEKSPRDNEAKKGIFEIANWYFEQKDFGRALKIYEDGAARWPNQLNDNPEIHFRMAEIYFHKKQFGKARRHYFALINLAPDSENSHRALNRVGDSYLMEGKNMDGLSVFDESAKRNPKSPQSQYALIRMADIGLRDPTLPLRDIVFDRTPYFQPLETYGRVFREAVDQDILAEVTLSRGIAYLKDQRYLDAIQQFKKLLPLGPETRFYKEARKFIRQSLVFLVDQFSRQTGYLPILYTFTDYQNLSLGEINNVKTLVQIGEAYQSISMYEEAANFYEKAKKRDSRELYADRIFLNLGKMQRDQGRFKEAASIARTVLNRYPNSKLLPDALELQAQSYQDGGEFQKALATYQQLLDGDHGDASKIHFRRGQIYRKMNRLPEAITEFRRSIETYDRTLSVPPAHIPDAFFQLGTALYDNREYAQGLKVLKAGRQLFPDYRLNDWNILLTAESYHRVRKRDEAEDELKVLLESKSTAVLLKQAADSELKMIEWEKQFKDIL